MEPSYYTPAPQPKGTVWGLIGFLVAIVILYFVFIYAPFTSTTTEAALVGLGVIFAGGFISRKGKRGALIGFLILFLPLLTAGILLVLAGLGATSDSSSQGLPGVFEGLAQGLAIVVVATLGVILIVASFIIGGIGAIVGGIGGWIGGKVLPFQRPESAQEYEEYPYMGGYPPPPPP